MRQSLRKYIKKTIFACLDLQPTEFSCFFKNPLRVVVALAGLPRLPALTPVSFGVWRPTSLLLNSWGILVKQDFVKWVKEMGVLVVVRPHNSPGRPTDPMHVVWPLQHNLFLKQQVHFMISG